MIGPRISLVHPQYRRGRRLLPFLVALIWGPLACSNDQPTENGQQALPAPSTARLHPYLTVSDSNTPTSYQLFAPKVSLNLAVSALGAPNGPKVLILADADGPSTNSLAASLSRAGYQVFTRPAPENTWTGNDPALTGFAAVIHLDGVTWNAPLSAGAQTALSNFVQNGGGFIAGQWNGYEQSTGRQAGMPNLVLQNYGTTGREQDCSRCAVTYTVVSGQSGHPVLAGLPASFSLSADGHHAGAMIPFLIDPSTLLMRVASGNPGIVVRQFGRGKVVNFSFSPNYSWGGTGNTLKDANALRLYLNAVRWVAGSPPDADGDGVPDFADNCPTVSNPAQTDSNGNGVGDACEEAQSQSIDFGPLNGKIFGDPDFAVSATATSKLLVSFGASGKCSISGTTVHLTGAGSCTITARQGGDDRWKPAEPVSRSFAIAKASASLALGNLSQTYTGSPRAATATTSPAGLGTISITYNGSATAPTNAGSYAARATLDNDDYEAAPATGTLVIAKARATITLSYPPAVFDGAPKYATASTAPAGLSGVTITYTQNGVTVPHPTNAGSYLAQAHLEHANYEAADVQGTLTIRQALPTIRWADPAPIILGTSLGRTQLNAWATGVGNTVLDGRFVYNPGANTVLSIGSHTLGVQFTPEDPNYTGASKTVQIAVVYRFSGFFQPVDNMPTMNTVKAGSTVPLKFDLGGNQGLAILRAGSPSSSAVACAAASVAGSDAIEETVEASKKGLKYTGKQYHYNWETSKSWSGSCRKLRLTLVDGTIHEAVFQFK